MAGENSFFRLAKAKGPKGEDLTNEDYKRLMKETELEPISDELPRTAVERLRLRNKDKEEKKDKELFRAARKRGDSKKDVLNVEYIAETN